jgi:hypothetical protein
MLHSVNFGFGILIKKVIPYFLFDKFSLKLTNFWLKIECHSAKIKYTEMLNLDCKFLIDSPYSNFETFVIFLDSF